MGYTQTSLLRNSPNSWTTEEVLSRVRISTYGKQAQEVEPKDYKKGITFVKLNLLYFHVEAINKQLLPF